MTKHKLIGIIFPLVLLFCTFLPIVSHRVNAESSKTTMKEQYKIWRSYRVVMDCINDSFSLSDETLDKDARIIGSIFTSRSVGTGNLYNQYIGLDGDSINCQVLSDMNAVLKNLGYSGVRDFGYKLSEGSSGDIKKSKVEDILKNKVTSSGSRLALNEQPDFQYWFANQVYRDKSNGCDGVLNKDPGRETTNKNGPFYYVSSEANKPPEEFAYANYNKPKGGAIEGIDNYMTRDSVFADDKPSCDNISGWMAGKTGKARADAYAKFAANNTAEQSEIQKNESGDDGGQSCESNNSGAISWLLCGLVGAIDDVLWGGDGTGGLVAVVDGLLSIENKYYQTPEMKEIWSSFKNLATLALVVVGLVMIIGQALSKD